MDSEGDKPVDAEGSAKPDGASQTRSTDAAEIAAPGRSENGPLEAARSGSAQGPVSLAEPVARSEGAQANLVRPLPPPSAPVLNRRPRRIKLPVILFVATCLSTFYVDMSGWDFWGFITEPIKMLRENWWQGMAYMLSVMSILLAHEMGHFLQAVRYGVPASLPFFIPLPITPSGTMGAVIALGGSQADRKQLFDIGLTGPLAGLVVALPLTCWGLITATPLPPSSDASLGGWHFGDPLVFKILVAWLRPDVPDDSRLIVLSNPVLFAGWVGMLVTGLNMLPIGQLDGGHVVYALMGRRSYWLARAMVLASVVFIVVSREYSWSVMLLLVVYLGIHHPPTANDTLELGRPRTVLGWLSLAIPLFCLPPFPAVPS